MDMECPICFEDCAEKQVIATPCGHLYCQDCLENPASVLRATRYNRTFQCHICRTSFKALAIRKIYLPSSVNKTANLISLVEVLQQRIKGLEEREKFQAERADYLMKHEGEQVRQLKQEVYDAKLEGVHWKTKFETLERDVTDKRPKAAGISLLDPSRTKGTPSPCSITSDSVPAHIPQSRAVIQTRPARRNKSKHSPVYIETPAHFGWEGATSIALLLSLRTS